MFVCFWCDTALFILLLNPDSSHKCVKGTIFHPARQTFVLQKTASWSYLIITSPVILSLGTKSILCLFLYVAYLRESHWMLVLYPYMILVALFFWFGLCFEIQSVANMHFNQKTFHWIITSVNPIAVFTFTFSDYHECLLFRHSNSSIILVGTKWK